MVDPNTTVAVEFGGCVVYADAGGPVANVRVSLYVLSLPSGRPTPDGWVFPKNTATSDGDGTFTLPLNLPSSCRFVSLNLTGPPGYDDRHQRFEAKTAADRQSIRVYPTLVIRPGESIEVRVDNGIAECGWGARGGLTGVSRWQHRRVTPLTSSLCPTTAASPWH